MAETSRPKRNISRPNYRDLSGISLRLPRLSKRVSEPKPDRKLYRLKILEEDYSNGLVKISYIGYGNEWDD